MCEFKHEESNRVTKVTAEVLTTGKEAASLAVSKHDHSVREGEGWRWWVTVCLAMCTVVGGASCFLRKDTVKTGEEKEKEVGRQGELKVNIYCCVSQEVRELSSDLWGHPCTWESHHQAVGTPKPSSTKYIPPSALPPSFAYFF